MTRTSRAHGIAMGRMAMTVLIGTVALIDGCATAQSPISEPTAPDTSADALPLETQASADRLHEIAGCLLLYYSQYGQLPDTLDVLRDDATLACPPLVSPTSGKAYVYHRPPLPMGPRPGALLIHEPVPYASASQVFGEPVHWALLVDAEQGGASLGTQVIFVAAREIRTAQQRAQHRR